jgi:hypothetical protein
MHRIAWIGAVCLAVAGLVAYALGASGSDGAVRAQSGPGGGPSGGMSAGPPGGGSGGGMPPMGGGMPGMGAPAAGAEAPAAPTLTATRRKRTDLAADQDVVADVVSPSILKLDTLGYVHLAGVVTPREYFALRSDREHFEGESAPTSTWKRTEGARYKENETPDDYTYNTGEEDLRLFVYSTVINKVVKVEKVGEYTLQGAKKEWKMPDVVLTFTRPQILTTDSTDPINLNDLVIAETKQIPMHNNQWELGEPARFDATTQSWLNPKWNRLTGRVAPSLRDQDDKGKKD